MAPQDPGQEQRTFLAVLLVMGVVLVWTMIMPRPQPTAPDETLPAVDRSVSSEMTGLRGGASDYVREAHRGRIRRHFPNAVVRSIEGAGHWLHAERPDDFLAVAREFLSCP